MNAFRLASLAVAAAATIAVTETQASATCSYVQQCYTNPGYVPGANRGDLVFKYPPAGSGGIVTGALQGLGLHRTHTGMMLDASRVRHNSLTAASLNSDVYKDKASVCLNGVNSGNVHFNASGLRSGGPGLHTAYAADELDPDSGGHEWGSNVTLLKAKDESTSRTRASAAATYLESVNMGYSLYGYSQFWGALSANSASMCSGSIYLAWYSADAQHGGYGLVSHSVAERTTQVNTLYSALTGTNGLYSIVFPQMPNGCAASQSTDAWNAADILAAQLVNTMAYNETNNYDPAATLAGPGTGSTISPDDLVSEGNNCILIAGRLSCTPSAARPYVSFDVFVTPVPTTTTCKQVLVCK